MTLRLVVLNFSRLPQVKAFYAIISGMGGNETFSANSKNLQKFQLQQKARSLILVLIIVVPILLGIVAYAAYRQAIAPKAETATTPQTLAAETAGEVSSDTGDQAPASIDPNTAVSNGATSSSSGNASSASSLPAGVTTAMNSIEANGIKGNPYVSGNLDTTSVPDGTSVRFNRSSWKQLSDTSGTADASVTYFGQNKAGTVTFDLSNGTWQVSGYSLS